MMMARQRGEAKEMVGARIPVDLVSDLRHVSELTGISVSRLVEDAVRSHLNRYADLLGEGWTDSAMENLEAAESLEAQRLGLLDPYDSQITDAEVSQRAAALARRRRRNG